MPQLVKGGKYVFGWSRIRENGSTIIPDEAAQEYRFSPGNNVFLMSGSKTSGGFIIVKKSTLEQSSLHGTLAENPELFDFQTEEGKTIKFKKRNYCWVKIRENNIIILNPQILEAYGIKPGNNLLAARGSNLGLAMIAKGPIVEYARTHPEINIYS